MKVKEGDILNICFEQYGDIKSFKVEKIGRNGPCEDYGLPAYDYIRVKKIESTTV